MKTRVIIRRIKILIILLCVIFILPNSVSNRLLSALPIWIKIGQMIMVGFNGKNKDYFDVKYLQNMINRRLIGGILILPHNIDDKEQVTKLLTDIRIYNNGYPLFVGVDQEGGRISRLNKNNGFTDYSSAHEVCKEKTLSEAYTMYREMSGMLKEAGFNLNFAPVVDLNKNDKSPAIGKLERSFSDDPITVYMYSKAFIEAQNEVSILSTIKHFPGHGSAAGDTHKEMTDISDSWSEEELLPFAMLIQNEIVDMVMTAHVYNSNIDCYFPATLSKKCIDGILRQQLKYNGVVITDDLQMAAIKHYYSLEHVVINSINAGNDILLFSNYIENDYIIPIKVIKIVINAIKDGIISEKRINTSYNRIMKLKSKL